MSAKTSERKDKTSKKGDLEVESPSMLKSFIIGWAIFAGIFCPFAVVAGFLAQIWKYTGGGIIFALPLAFVAGVIVALPFAIVFARKASK
jgi:hypothetical protein